MEFHINSGRSVKAFYVFPTPQNRAQAHYYDIFKRRRMKDISLLYRKGKYTTIAIFYNDKFQGIDLIGEVICIDTAMTH